MGFIKTWRRLRNRHYTLPHQQSQRDTVDPLPVLNVNPQRMALFPAGNYFEREMRGGLSFDGDCGHV
jgi:hypothetical protein